MKQIISIILALSLLCVCSLAMAEGQRGPGGRGGRGGAGGGVDKSNDTELQTMIAEAAPKFQLLTYDDVETGTSLQYQLFIPENYDAAQSYPLIQFIPDSSVVGRDASYVLTGAA